MSKNSVTLFGRHAVLEALKNEAREIMGLWVTPDMLDQLKAMKLSLPVSPSMADRKDLDNMVPRDAVHQGIVAKVGRLPVSDMDEVLYNLNDGPSCVLILDQVTDPHNVGAILRSAAAFGCAAVIVQDRNSPDESGTLAKSASGGLEVVPLVRVTNISRALQQLKNAGFWCVGFDGEAELPLTHISSPDKYALVLGAEGAGLRRLTTENCDYVVKLPTRPPISSLNVSNAAAIALYHVSVVNGG